MYKYSYFAKTLGYYIPNRFILNLPEVHLPITSSSPEDFTVFIHEYTHLLQNVFTVSGWTSFAFEMLKYDALMNICFRDNKYIVPVFYNHNLAEDRSKIEHSIQYAEYLFDNDEKLVNAKIKPCSDTDNLQKEITTNFPLGFENKGINIFTYFYVNGRRTKISINYYTLIESMAYIIENHYSLASIKSPDYPYGIIQMLFSCTKVKSLEQQIVMIYLSLQSQFPHILFYKIFSLVISRKLYTYLDVDIFSLLIIKCLPDEFESTLPNHIKMLKTVFNELSNHLTRYPLANESVKWLNECSNNFFENITTSPLKYLKPILNKKLGSDEIFEVVDFNYFLVKDHRNSLSIFKKKPTETSGITFLSNLFHFIDYFLFYDHCNLEAKDWKCCPLYFSCKLKEFKDSKCLTEPYLKGQKKIRDQLCDYGSVSHMFFVHEVPIHIKKNV